MKPTPIYYDNQQTFEVKTYEVSLSCGACGEGKFLPISEYQKLNAIHACTNCGRELAIDGLSYPRAEVKRVLATERIIETTTPVGLNEPPAKLTPWEIEEMAPQLRAERLKTTVDVELVDILRAMTQEIL